MPSENEQTKHLASSQDTAAQEEYNVTTHEDTQTNQMSKDKREERMLDGLTLEDLTQYVRSKSLYSPVLPHCNNRTQDVLRRSIGRPERKGSYCNKAVTVMENTWHGS